MFSASESARIHPTVPPFLMNFDKNKGVHFMNTQKSLKYFRLRQDLREYKRGYKPKGTVG